MTRLALLCAILFCCSCAVSLEQSRAEGRLTPRGPGEVRDDKRCQELDQEYRTWSAWAAAFVAGAGSTGLAQMPTYELPERYRAGTRFGLAGGTVTFAILAEYAHDRSSKAADTWARECSQ